MWVKGNICQLEHQENMFALSIDTTEKAEAEILDFFDTGVCRCCNIKNEVFVGYREDL